MKSLANLRISLFLFRNLNSHQSVDWNFSSELLLQLLDTLSKYITQYFPRCDHLKFVYNFRLISTQWETINLPNLDESIGLTRAFRSTLFFPLSMLQIYCERNIMFTLRVWLKIICLWWMMGWIGFMCTM